MLATPGPAPDGGSWAAEVKGDGMRLQLRFDGKRVCARSRPGRDFTESFPELDDLADALDGRRFLLDGELVCLASDGKPDFAALRRRLVARPSGAARSIGEDPVTFMVFDILHQDGRAVRELPYRARRQLLAELNLDGAAWRTPAHYVGDARSLADATAAEGLGRFWVGAPSRGGHQGRNGSSVPGGPGWVSSHQRVVAISARDPADGDDNRHSDYYLPTSPVGDQRRATRDEQLPPRGAA